MRGSMSRKDTIMKAAKRTANEAKAAAKKRTRGLIRSESEPHRHCVVCWTPIPLDNDPAVCAKRECGETQINREKSRKRLTVMLYLFPAIAVLFVILEIAV